MQLSLKAMQTAQKPASLNPQRLTEMEEILHTLVFLFDFHAVAQRPAVVLERPSTAQSCCGQKFSARGESLVQFVPVVLKTRGGNHHCSNRVSQWRLTANSPANDASYTITDILCSCADSRHHRQTQNITKSTRFIFTIIRRTYFSQNDFTCLSRFQPCPFN